MSGTYWLVGRLYATYPESFKQGQGVQILILQVVTFSRICLNHVLSQCFSCLSTFDMLVLAPCMVPTLHACQASAPSRSPQRRNSKSQEVEEDAGVFCSWTAVSYMHTSQNTAASSVCCSVVLPKCDMRKVNWMESTTKSCCHSYIRHPAPCLTRTKRLDDMLQILTCEVLTLSLAQVAQECRTSANCLWHFSSLLCLRIYDEQ